jgi:hypothetical protein
MYRIPNRLVVPPSLYFSLECTLLYPDSLRSVSSWTFQYVPLIMVPLLATCPKSHLNCIKLLVLVNEEVIHLRRYRKLYENSSSTEPPNKQLRKTTLIICFLIGINDKWQFLGRKTVLCNSAFLSLFAYSFLFSSSFHVASRGLRSVIVLLLF